MKKEYFKPKAIVVSIDSSSILAGSDGPGNGGEGFPGANAGAKKYSQDWSDEDF